MYLPMAGNGAEGYIYLKKLNYVAKISLKSLRSIIITLYT